MRRGILTTERSAVRVTTTSVTRETVPARPFDVVGPVTLDHPVAYYGANTDYRDENAERMIIEACRKAERAGVDFSQYDFDNDGKIDNVFVYYAGHNESDGGGMNTVWPHRGEISYPGEMLGGKELCVYACTSELSGSPDFDSRMAGIGTFCHEFGHVLGWPDFYDTNGSDFGTGVGVFNWSLMCQGSRNDGGRTPPSLTAMERMMAVADPDDAHPFRATTNSIPFSKTRPT